MKKYFLPLILSSIFVIIGGFQYYQNYKFRIQPPSAEWSKEVVISKGKVKSTPKIIKYKDEYVIAHDDEQYIKVILVDKLGKKLGVKTLDGKDKFIKDVNLLTDGEYIFLNWTFSRGTVYYINNLKMDKDLNIIDEWENDDIRGSAQVGSSLMMVAYSNKIEVADIKTGSSNTIKVKFPTKIAGTETKNGYLITYNDKVNYYYFTMKNDVISQPRLILRRPDEYRELYFDTAVACDDKYGYIILERKVKNTFGKNIIITFPLEGGEKKTAVVYNGVSNVEVEMGNGVEKDFKILPGDDFIYSPISVSSGDEARFIVGYARKYGNSERQFDMLDFSLRDGEVVKSTVVDKTREGTTMPWITGDMLVFLNQAKSGEYNVCMASQNEEFVRVNNGVKNTEIRLAFLDTLTSLANSLFGVFTIGIRWILPVMLLISIVTLFGYKLNLKGKKIVFLLNCIIAAVLKTYFAKNIYYGTYINVLPGHLRPVFNGMVLFLVFSLISYIFGYSKYKRDLNNNPDVMPIFTFVLALTIDTILTQFVYSPFIM